MEFRHLSRIYLSDDELFELLAPKNVGHRGLLKLARRRGFIFSEKARDADIRSRLALVPSDWQTISGILHDMARPDPEERKTSVHVKNCSSENDVTALVDAIKEQRKGKKDESYNISKIAEDTTRIEVGYTEIDGTKAIPFQRRVKKLYVDVTTDGDKVSFRYTANVRAKEIVDSMRSALLFKPKQQAKIEFISLRAVRDAAKRTKFFMELIKDINGFKFEKATHVAVDCRLPIDDEEEELEGIAGTAEAATKAVKAAKAIKGSVNKAALSGDQVLTDNLYQQAAKTGYYIWSISWSCVSKADSRIHIDCEAAFSESIKADQLTWDVVRQWQYKPEAPDHEEPVKMSEGDKRRYVQLIEEAAFRAYSKIQK